MNTRHEETSERDFDMEPFLQPSALIDWNSPLVLAQAARLKKGDVTATARSCFEWVRDEIQHSGDAALTGTSCKASEVLSEENGWCFAKSHLLAALLRANGIAAGLCYQRLKLDETRFTLHGLNVIWLPNFGWYRVDPRGNKNGVNAQFTPPNEQLAWTIDDEGEMDFPKIYPEPLAEVCAWLNSNRSHEQALATLPDFRQLPE